MKTNVARLDLMDILTANRSNHRDLYDKALTNWRDQLLAELGKLTEEVRAGKKVRISSMLPIPEDHTEDYDAALKLLEMSVDDTVELDENEVTELVLDNWHWHQSFAANTLRYT